MLPLPRFGSSDIKRICAFAPASLTVRLNQDPTKAQANLNSMNNCVIVLSKRELGEAIASFQEWLSNNFGNVDSMVGYLVTMKTIEFVSHCMRRTDEVAAYAAYFRLKQGRVPRPAPWHFFEMF